MVSRPPLVLKFIILRPVIASIASVGCVEALSKSLGVLCGLLKQKNALNMQNALNRNNQYQGRYVTYVRAQKRKQVNDGKEF